MKMEKDKKLQYRHFLDNQIYLKNVINQEERNIRLRSPLLGSKNESKVKIKFLIDLVGLVV